MGADICEYAFDNTNVTRWTARDGNEISYANWIAVDLNDTYSYNVSEITIRSDNMRLVQLNYSNDNFTSDEQTVFDQFVGFVGYISIPVE
ncbi:MAG TPA: hypothetical protein VI875_02355, partial [Candidatus Norongarragalinales archaeon]|nr:hypothetical protein [Candidatus Norongarragalinales archaeon]